MTFHLMFVGILFLVRFGFAERPPIRKEMPTRLTICSLCILNICNFSYFSFLVMRAGFGFPFIQFLIIAYLLFLFLYTFSL